MFDIIKRKTHIDVPLIINIKDTFLGSGGKEDKSFLSLIDQKILYMGKPQSVVKDFSYSDVEIKITKKNNLYISDLLLNVKEEVCYYQKKDCSGWISYVNITFNHKNSFKESERDIIEEYYKNKINNCERTINKNIINIYWARGKILQYVILFDSFVSDQNINLEDRYATLELIGYHKKRYRKEINENDIKYLFQNIKYINLLESKNIIIISDIININNNLIDENLLILIELEFKI